MSDCVACSLAPCRNWVDEEFNGRGIGSAALSFALDYSRQDLGLHRLPAGKPTCLARGIRPGFLKREGGNANQSPDSAAIFRWTTGTWNPAPGAAARIGQPAICPMSLFFGPACNSLKVRAI